MNNIIKNTTGNLTKLSDSVTVLANITDSSEIAAIGIHDYNAEKHRQLHIILAIIVSVFSACVIILVAYMVIFPASYTEVDTRVREPDSSSTEEKTTTVSGQKEETKPT